MAKQLGYHPITTGISLEQQDLTNNVSIPNQHDENAKLFADIGGSLGPRPRGWAALASGVAKGLEYSERSKSTAKKQEFLDKYNRFIDYFRNQNMQMGKRLQWEEQKKQELEILRPYAVGGMEVSYSGMPYEQGNQAMRNLFEQIKINNPKLKGDYVGYVPNSPLINIRDENGNPSVISLSNFAGEDVSKRIQGDYIDRQRNSASMISANASMMNAETNQEYAPQKYEIQENKAKNAEERLRLQGDKTYQAAKAKYAPKIEAASRVRVVAAKMKDLVINNPGMFQSVLSSVWDSNDPGIIQKLAQQATNGKSAEAIKEMGKYIQELKIGVIKGLSNPNQSIDMIAAGTIPGKGMPDNSILKILDDLDYKAEHEMKLNEEYLNDVRGAFGENNNGGTKYAEKAQEYINNATKENVTDNQSGTKIMIRTPDGITMKIPESYLDQAIANGAEVVDG